MIARLSVRDGLGLVCPSCRGSLEDSRGQALDCPRCHRHFPEVAGLPDLRLASDRYLRLPDERAKAERLGAIEPLTDVNGLARAYYELTDDVVDHRRDRFLGHIAGAVPRGEALLRRLPSGGKILEVGAGTGGLLVAAARAGRDVTGVDIASRWLVVARRRLTDQRLIVPLVVAEAERLPWPDGWFDCLVADSLIEHLDDPAAALIEFRRVLKPGGRLLLWSPNRFSLTIDPHLGVWGLGWLPRAWLPRCLGLFGRTEWPPRTRSAREMGQLTRRTGWTEIELDAPEIDETWARSRPLSERRMLQGYQSMRARNAGRGFLRRFGPLWELRALAGVPG